MSKKKILVAGGGGFIGGHLVARLLDEGHAGPRVDIKPIDEWYQVFGDVENVVADLKDRDACDAACRGRRRRLQPRRRHGRHGLHREQQGPVHAQRADQHAPAAGGAGEQVRRGSSTPPAPASTTPTSRRAKTSSPLKEEDAYPAMPEDGYGWEKLFSERMCRHFREDFGLYTRVARFHNVYGPFGTWDGGREKAPAAICRKVIQAKETGEHDDRNLGRRQADPQLHVHRRLPQGHPRHHGQRHHRADQPRLQRAGDDQRPGRHRRGHRRRQARAATTTSSAPKGVNGRNSDNTLIKKSAGLGAGHQAPRRHGEDLRLDLRRVPQDARQEAAAASAALARVDSVGTSSRRRKPAVSCAVACAHAPRRRRFDRRAVARQSSMQPRAPRPA